MCSIIKYNKFNKILLIICITAIIFGLTMAENSTLNATTTAEFKEQHQPPAAAAVDSDDNLTIKHILTNLTMFNTEDFNENDPSMALIIENVTHTCLQGCIEEETNFLNDFGLKCKVGDNRPACYRARCFKGCELWWHSLKEFEPCQEACSSTQFYPYDLPCISVCEASQRQYWHLLRLHVERLLTAMTTATTTTTTTPIHSLLQPQLLPDNETLNTLTLKWPIITAEASTTEATATSTLFSSLFLASRPFNIQYQYVLKASSIPTSSSLPTTTTANLTVNVTNTPGINREQEPELERNKEEQQQHQHQQQLQKIESLQQQPDNQMTTLRQQHGSNDYNGINDGRLQVEEEEEQQQQQWWNLADYNCNENFECDIMDGLMPYTTYRFRFALPFGDNLEDILYSPPSIDYTTPAMGRPISQPVLQQSLALDDTHLAVFWQPGKFINGPLTYYKIQIKSAFESHPRQEEFLPPTSSYYIFSNLTASTLYTVSLAMLNSEGEGPPFMVNLTTKARAYSAPLKLDDLNTLILAGEYSIILKSLDPLVESRVLYKSEEILMDFDVNQYTKRLFVVDKSGQIKSFQLDDAANYTDLHLTMKDEDFIASKLSVDWLNQKLYIAGVLSTTKNWQLLRCDLDGSAVETIAHGFKPLKHLQVDPLNGWIFATDDGHLLWKMDLSSGKLEYIRQAFEMEHFSNQQQNFLITAYNAKEREIYELSYDGGHKERLNVEVNAAFQGDVLWFLRVEDWLIMTNGSFLLRQDMKTMEWDLLSFKEIEWCWKVKPLLKGSWKDLLQARLKPLKEPENLRALISDNKAKIMWQKPAMLLRFQSSNAWQNWEYELDILDVLSNNAFNIRSIKTNYFQVERLQPNNLYRIKVRAMFSGLTRQQALTTAVSEWSQELLTRTWPAGSYSFLWATEQGLKESEELLKPPNSKALEGQNILMFKQVNTSLYYIEKQQNSRLMSCVNLMNPIIRCGFQQENVFSMDYDPRAGKLYWSDVKRDCVLRSDLNGHSKELLPIFGARLLKLDSGKGFIYFNTDSQMLRKKLNGGLQGQELEYYHVKGNGETIQGFALDYTKSLIYWWIELQEGSSIIMRSDMDFVKAEILESFQPQALVLPNSFVYNSELETFLWLNKLNRKAVLAAGDHKLQMTLVGEDFSLQKNNFVELKRDFIGYPDIMVIPEAVDPDTVTITEGYWDDFNIKWSAINVPDNYSITYKVLITAGDFQSDLLLTFEVMQPLVRITEFKMAGFTINVTILPCTVWSQGEPTRVQLKTPSAAPKQPKNLRVFVEQFRDPLDTDTNITALVRWDSPDNISAEKEVFYKVYCWLQDNLHSVKDIEDMGQPSHELRFYNLLKEQSYNFQVQAFSLTRSKGGEKTSLLQHFINPEQQSVPKLLIATRDFIGEIDLDLNVTKQWVFTPSEVDHLVVINQEHRLLWVNENVELMAYQPGSASLKLARMRAEVLALTVDWISRKVYWAEIAKDKQHLVEVYSLDLNQYEGKVMLGKEIFSLSPKKLLKDLIVLPYAQAIVWLEYDFGSTNCTLHGRNLTDLRVLKFNNLPQLSNMFEGSLLPDMETLNLVDLKGKLYTYELQRQLLTPMKQQSPQSEALNQVKFQRDAGFIYMLANHTIQAFNRRKHTLEYSHHVPEIKLIKAFNYQEYPPRQCLIMEYSQEADHEIQPSHLRDTFLREINEDSMILKLPSKNPFENCLLDIPGLRYQILIQDFNGDYERRYDLQPGLLNVTDLKPFTNYSVEIKTLSYYQQKYQLMDNVYPIFQVRTLEGNPSKPENFTAKALSPTEILVSWQQPLQLNAAEVNYHLYWQLLNSSLTSHKLVDSYEVLLENLEPQETYQIWLEVYSLPSKLNSSDKISIKTFNEPSRLELIEQQAYNLTLNWPMDDSNYETVILECQALSTDLEDPAFSLDITNQTTNISVANLLPKTRYEFYLKLFYKDVDKPYIYPELPASRYVFETLGDAPGRPGQPQIEHITGEIFKVFWEPAKDNGAAIVEYNLEALQARQQQKRIRRQVSNISALTTMAQLPWVEELEPVEDKWVNYCNTSELSCIVRELHTMRFLMFRVRARNEPYGWGPYSEDSERVLEPFVSPQKRHSLVMAIILPAAIVTTCVIILIIIRKVQKRRLKAKQLLAKSRPSIWSNFSTLQQQLAERNRTFSLTSNSTMYTGGPLSDADIALLPHISWSQITLLNFLGQGAFGEVYEGMLKHQDQEEEEKVAIKSLRKGASEFAELLQEAQLMSNFKHENIVRLIGVCCDAESISIIMEHMEGGDLLSYLRESRPNSTKPVASLQLLDLMTMCIDVATGMAYLEDMHFVHRDLACRNCLVSSRVPSKRTVKIGDFGLARDIYKNDYYRKEGEALMPVRWMAPESLVDGVFTTQSDVWAFGVLCWEILTLGQQPYAARNNFEVLNFVKDGGRLEQPDNCPDKLFSLMMECWYTEPEQRPTFRRCFNTLLAIKTDVRRVNMGYNIDDSDYAMYANQHGIVMSSFLASPGLKKVKEEDETQEEEELHKYEIKQNSLNSQNEQELVSDKSDLKVRFRNNISPLKEDLEENSGGSHTDETQLIDAKLYRIQENPDYYVNEGVSRL